MKTYKDTLIMNLITFINSQTLHLTRDDIEMLTRKIWELNDEINRTYQERHDSVFGNQ